MVLLDDTIVNERTVIAGASPGPQVDLSSLGNGALQQTVSSGVASLSVYTPANNLAKYIVQQPDASLPNAQALSALTTGLVKNTTATGVLSIAVAGVDYVTPPELNYQFVQVNGSSEPQRLRLNLLGGFSLSDNPGNNSTDVIALGGAATWAANVVRTFLYDPVNGNDANPGFSDVAGPYNPATLAKQTAASLQTIFPRNFAGRSFRLLIASGTYISADLDLLLSGATGIGSGSVVKATFTNSTAGATAFADDTNDRIFIGATTATGCNAAGYNPTGGATTTTIPCQLNGGGAAGLGVEPASPLMWRLRFDVATTTVALRNICRTVIAVSGGNTVTLDTALPATPATGDVFYLEMAGVSFPSIRVGGTSSVATSAGGISNGLQIVGIRSAGTTVYGEGYYTFVLSGGGPITFRTSNIQAKASYFDPVAGSSFTPGGGLRSETSLIVQTNMQANFTNVACVGELSILAYGQLVGSNVVVGAGFLNNCTSAESTIGISSLRILGPEDEAGMEMQSSWMVNTDSTNTVSITGCTGFPAIKLDGVQNKLQMSSQWAGSTGNTDVGLDLTSSKNSIIYLSSQPTVTGSLGDVRLSDGTIITWAQAMAGILDKQGNQITSANPFPIQRLPAGTYVTDLSAGGAVSATAGTGLLTVGPAPVANWPTANYRVYAVDYDNGSDANAGFADAASSSYADFQAACVAAGAVAKKTMQGLGLVLPSVGAGRKVFIQIASRTSGATYLKQDAVTVDSLDSFMQGCDGYAQILIWGTGTNATAGATKFTGTVNDLTYAGAVTVTGTNTNGYNPTGAATASSVPCTLVGGGAPGLAGEPAAPLGYSTRFGATTTTTTLRNVCRGTQVVSTTATTNDTVSPQAAWPATPVAGDVFYLEQPGVVCNGWGQAWGSSNGQVVLCGIRSLTLVNYGPGPSAINHIIHMFVGMGGSTSLATATTGIGAFSSVDPGVGSGVIARGSTIRTEGSALIQPNTTFPEMNSVVCAGNLLLEFENAGVWAIGSVFAAGVTVQGGFTASLQPNNPGLGNATTALQCRIISPGSSAGLSILGGTFNVKDTQITGCGAKPAIKLTGTSVLYIQGTSGSSGNTDVGLDLTTSQGSRVTINATPTVTGTAGDVRLSDGTIVTWAQAAAGIQDAAGNVITSASAYPIQRLPTGTYLIDLAAGGSVLAAAGTGLLSVGPISVATWSLSAQRWYAVDGVNGSDTDPVGHPGYSDTSEADAGTKALKTLARLYEILPKNGAGRNVKIVIANGGVNTAATYTDGLPTYGIQGYSVIGIIGTGTNANAGAVAFDGSANTDVYAGGVTVPGLFANGYNPTGTPTTTSWTLQQVGGGAAALPAEPAPPLGWRVRFDINTSTVALRGICKQISQVNSSSQLTIDGSSPLTVAPSASDVFYIEKAGVLVGFTTVSLNSAATAAFLCIAGMDMSGLTILNGNPQISFSGTTTFNMQAPGGLQVINLWQGNFPGATRRTGGGLVVSGNTNNAAFGGGKYSSVGAATFVGTVEMLDPPGGFIVGNGVTFASGVSIHGSPMAIESPDGVDTFGGTVPNALLRIIGPGTYIGGSGDLVLRGTNLTVRNVSMTGSGSSPVIRAIGQNNVVFGGVASGSTGNNDVGLDLTAAYNSRFSILVLPTITGAVGDIRLNDGTIITWTQASAGIIDSAGNQIVAPGTPFPVQRKPTGTYLTDLSAGGFVTAVPGTGLLSVGIVPGASIYADGIVTGAIQLASIGAALLQAGTIAYVNSVDDSFQLQANTQTPDNITIVAASGKAGFNWVRLGIYSARWAAVTAWTIDPANISTTANDENPSTGNLLTYSELARRLSQVVFTAPITITVISDQQPSDKPVFTYKTTAEQQVNFVGVPTILHTGSVTSYVAATVGTPAADDNQMGDTGIPTSFTASGLMAQGVLFQRTNGTPVAWWAAKDLGSKTIRVAWPMNLSAITTIQTLSPGDTYTASALPLFSNAIFPVGQEFGTTIKNFKSSRFNNPGGEQLLYQQVWFTAAGRDGGAFQNCAFSTNYAWGANGGQGSRSAVTGGLFMGTGTTTYSIESFQTMNFEGNALTVQSARILIELSQVVAFQINFYDVPDNGSFSACLWLLTEAKYQQTVQCIGGKGNSTPMVSVTNSWAEGVSFTDASTSFSPSMYVNNVGYHAADLPVSDVNSSTFVGTQQLPLTAGIVQSNASGILSLATVGAGLTYVGTTLQTALAATAVGFGSGSNTLTGDAPHFSFDGTNHRLFISGTNAADTAGLQGLLNIQLEGGAGESIWMSANAASIRNEVVADRSRGTRASPTVLTAGDVVFDLLPRGYDGTAYKFSVEFGTSVPSDGTISSGNVPQTFWVSGEPTGGNTAPGAANWALAATHKRNVFLGEPNIATNATNGFVYLPTTAGVPTGVPTYVFGGTQNQNRDAIVLDDTHQRLYMYVGGWKAIGQYDGTFGPAIIQTDASGIHSAVTIGGGLTYSGGVLSATSGGSVTSVSAVAPLFVTNPTTTPQVTIQGSIVSGSTSTSAQNLGLLGNGTLQQTVSSGIATVSAFNGTTGSVPFYTTNSQLAQDAAHLFWDATHARLGVGTNAPANPLHVIGRLQVGDGTTASDLLSIATGAVAGGYQLWKDTTPTKAMNVALGVPGGSVTNDLIVSAFGGSAWTEVARFLNTGGFEVASLSAGGIVKAAASTGLLSIAVSGTDYQPPGAYITALTTDVVATGPGSAVATIQPHVVTYSKMQTESALTLLGNPNATPGNVQEVTLGIGLGFVNHGGGPVLENTSPLSNLTVTAPLTLISNNIAFPGAISYGGPGSINIGSFSTGLLKVTSGAGPGGGAGLSIAVAGTDYQAPITWPTAGEILFSSGTSTVPSGNANLVVDTTFGPTVVIGSNFANSQGNQLRIVPQATLVATSSFGPDTLLVDGQTVTLTSPVNINYGGGYDTVRVQPTTYTAGSALTMLAAASVKIEGDPVGGTNVTITNPYALWIGGGHTRIDGALRLSNITGPAYLQVDASGNVSAGSTAPLPFASYKFSTNASISGGLTFNQGSVVVPGDSGALATSAGIYNVTVGQAIATTLSANYGTAGGINAYRINRNATSFAIQWTQLSATVTVANGANMGYALYSSSSPFSTAWTQIAGSGWTTGPMNIGTLANSGLSSGLLTGSCSISVGDVIALVAWRTDVASSSVLNNVMFSATLDLNA